MTQSLSLMRSITFGMVLMSAFQMASAQDDASSDVENSKSRETAQASPKGYFLGLSIGQTLARQGFEAGDFDPATLKALGAGIADAIAGEGLALSEDEIKKANENLQTMLNDRAKKLDEERQKVAKMNLEKGELWLEQNAKKEGIKTLAGGLQYKVLKEGDGGSPTASDTVKVHYTGKLLSGEVFDSSVERGEPAKFQVGGVIKGWQMAIQKMKVGDKWMIYIPPALAYGERGAPGAIGPNEVLVFEVELLEII